MLKTSSYNPDILVCLANLSSDEVFTPPKLANDMLDSLPGELWSNKDAKFLDAACKTGVFLREIAKRLMKGLEKDIPDLQMRINHIMKNQLYALAITELTSLISRRSVYCSKTANGEYSVCNNFKDYQGNIIYNRIEHTWANERCKYCGASKVLYDRGNELESHAYMFIHETNPKEILKMKFDVIIGNPPYQLNDGGAQASAIPLYHKFVQQAKRLNPRYITMIIPSRWFAGGKGLDEFRKEMLNDDRLRVIHDYLNASECFPGVEIKGGVCYFLWDRDNKGRCNVNTHSENRIISQMERPLLEDHSDVFIRYNEAIPIFRKVIEKNEEPISNIISARKPFGLPTNFNAFKKEPFPESVKIYANQKIGYIKREQILRNHGWIDKYKVLAPKAIGIGNVREDWLKPILGEPNSCCSETYIVIGVYNNSKEAENVISYIQTRFFHLLLSLRKITQDTTSKVYQFIPMQDFSEAWTDEKLYKKYSLSQEDIDFIEKSVHPDD